MATRTKRKFYAQKFYAKKGKTKSVCIFLTPSLHKKIRWMAFLKEGSIQKIVTEAVEKAVKGIRVGG